MRTGKPATLILLLIACTLLQANFATARVVTMEEMKDVFHDLTCKNAPWPKEQLQVESFTAQPTSLDLPAGKIEYQATSKPYPNYIGRKALNVMILVNGKEAGAVNMIGDLRLYGEIACTTRRLKRHEKLTANDIKMVRRDITMLGDDLIRQQKNAIGKQTTKSLQPGDIIRTSQLDEPPMVKRGEMVTIVAQAADIRITAPGEAKKNGAMGDIIKVKNLMSRKYIFAKVIADKIVQVTF
ncbi:MAG: flagellar basal body P-ring formation chaperone FlgA [Desulfobulbaceae bacterium]|nr:flagellar basal body P-ring formation chaperone FlgA [Desulfobulbaceae bacterium]